MTMPHLMNCSHDSDGWCLDCVKKLWDEKQAIAEAWVKDQGFRNKQREKLLDEVIAERRKWLEAMSVAWAAEEFTQGRIDADQLRAVVENLPLATA